MIETPEDERTATMEERAPDGIGALSDGMVRPGGPVNRPVPGTTGDGWPALVPSDLVGAWQMRLGEVALDCRMMLGGVNSAGSGQLVLTGICPFSDGSPARWRYDDRLGQVFLLDETGKIDVRLMRTGPDTFRAYSAEGWVRISPIVD
ncbi:MAG: AprI/Inh family metalloprotease inhibitor [Pseudomonadota bacterium]